MLDASPPALGVGRDATASTSPSRAAARTFWCVGAAALVIALVAAWRRSWVSDDAFISFRYAENLVRGLGLVFNQGERVEGYSNFLWTLWTAAGMWLHVDPERWVKATGLACYLAALGTLVWTSWKTRRGSTGLALWIPVAALLGALHPDWQIFATGGLETSLFTLEITLVYAVLALGEIGIGRAAAAGLLLALASLTRPDGPVIAVAAALYVLVADTRRPRAFVALCLTFLIVWGPYTAWRVGYYGDFFPNTYYAKSAAQAWVSQGVVYAALYFIRYWPLLVGPILVALAWPRGAHDGGAALDRWRRSAALAATLALVYSVYVIRIGGDFMFARFFIPVTPLFLVLFELGITRLAPRVRSQAILAGIAAAGIVLTPYPLPRDPFGMVRGIVFEPNFYSREANEYVRQEGLTLHRYFKGLPVRVAFLGGEARLMYYADPPVAIECCTGLTDRAIARQPLKKRGRIGHEKVASLDYVIGVRKAHFAFYRNAAGAFQLDRALPPVEIEMSRVRGRVLYWDPALMDSLRARGASTTDFPAELDRMLEEPSLAIKWRGWPGYEWLRRFYFGHVPDPRREALVVQRLREAQAAGVYR